MASRRARDGRPSHLLRAPSNRIAPENADWKARVADARRFSECWIKTKKSYWEGLVRTDKEMREKWEQERRNKDRK